MDRERQVPDRSLQIQIADAARTLFIKHGYARTSLAAITAAAGVDKRALISLFGSKKQLLAFLMDRSFRIQAIDQPEIQTIMHKISPDRLLARFSTEAGEALRNVAWLLEGLSIDAKTHADVADLLQQYLDGRLRWMRMIAWHLSIKGVLREGINQQRAVDILWALGSPEMYRLFRRDLNWTEEEYITWLADSVKRMLLL